MAEVSRKSLVFSKNMVKDEAIIASNFILMRPGDGIPAKKIENLVGKKMKMNVKKNTQVNWDMIEG